MWSLGRLPQFIPPARWRRGTCDRSTWRWRGQHWPLVLRGPPQAYSRRGHPEAYPGGRKGGQTMAEEQAPDPGPWTVKNVPLEDRAEINRAAKRADVTVGEWLRSAAALKLQQERGQLAPIPAGEDAGPPGEYRVGPSLEVVVQLSTRVLPGLTETKGSGRLAGLTRKVIEQHLMALMLGPPVGGPPRLAAPED